MKKSKVCTKCKTSKTLDNYNKHSTSSDGLTWWCKGCVTTFNKKYYKKNREQVLEQVKQYKLDNLEQSRERNRRWDIANRERRNERLRKYRKNNPKKTRARGYLNSALRSGKMTKLACEVCGNFLSEAHHPDYDKPLDVWFLCKKHHGLADKGELILYTRGQ